MENSRGHVGMTSWVSALFLEFPARKFGVFECFIRVIVVEQCSHVEGSLLDDALTASNALPGY